MSSYAQKVVDFVVQGITNRTGNCPIGGIAAVEIAEELEQMYDIIPVEENKENEEE